MTAVPCTVHSFYVSQFILKNDIKMKVKEPFAVKGSIPNNLNLLHLVFEPDLSAILSSLFCIAS